MVEGKRSAVNERKGAKGRCVSGSLGNQPVVEGDVLLLVLVGPKAVQKQRIHPTNFPSITQQKSGADTLTLVPRSRI